MTGPKIIVKDLEFYKKNSRCFINEIDYSIYRYYSKFKELINELDLNNDLEYVFVLNDTIEIESIKKHSYLTDIELLEECKRLNVPIHNKQDLNVIRTHNDFIAILLTDFIDWLAKSRSITSSYKKYESNEVSYVNLIANLTILYSKERDAKINLKKDFHSISSLYRPSFEFINDEIKSDLLVHEDLFQFLLITLRRKKKWKSYLIDDKVKNELNEYIKLIKCLVKHDQFPTLNNKTK